MNLDHEINRLWDPTTKAMNIDVISTTTTTTIPQ